MGEDADTEHYRWRAFCDFLNSKKNPDAELFRELYRLGKNDPDSAMSISMRVEILNLKNCPSDLLESALISEEKILKKVASRRLGKEFIP